MLYVLSIVLCARLWCFSTPFQISVYVRHHVHLRLGYDHRHRGSLICLHPDFGSKNSLTTWILIGWNDWIDHVDCSWK
jgi:hypothetical protein